MRATQVVIWVPVLAAYAATAAPVPPATADQEMKRLEGDWRVESLKLAGQESTDKRDKEFTWTFRGDKFRFQRPDQDEEPRWTTYRLNVAADPKQVDWSAPDGRKVEAIYKLGGDRLTICSPNPFVGGGRPVRFEADPKGKSILIVLVRKPPK